MNMKKNDRIKTLVTYDYVMLHPELDAFEKFVYTIIDKDHPCDTDTALVQSLFIRGVMKKLYSTSLSNRLQILYGGSVNSENAASYIREAKMDGLLIGGASLKAQEFIKIIKNVSET